MPDPPCLEKRATRRDADLTWSAVVGFEYRVASWGGVEFGYKGLGMDVKSDDRVVHDYDVTHYGPIFGFRFHWGDRPTMCFCWSR